MDPVIFKKNPVLGILRGMEADVIEPLAETVIGAGLGAIEITMNSKGAAGLIDRMARCAKGRAFLNDVREMFENLGNVRYIMGKLPEAIRAYNLSLWQEPNNTRVLKNLAGVLSRMGRTGEATRLWNRLRQLAPQDPDVQRVFHANPAAHP